MPRSRESDRPVMPSPEFKAHARELLQYIDSKNTKFALVSEDLTITLDEELFDILKSILIEIGQNRAVSVLPLNHELTTFQAADFLNVSRPYIIKLIEQGELPCRMVGTHRRIKLEDLIDYKERSDTASKEAREELIKQAQEDNMGY